MTDLNEASLLEALINIRSFESKDELRSKPRKLMVTEEGIAITRHRYETEPEFRAAVQETARENPDYRRLCLEVGLILDEEANDQ